MSALLRTELHLLRGPQSREIFIIANPTEEAREAANVLIAPPFGRSAKDLFGLAYYLWSSGFNVYRFDACDHIGFSSGGIDDFTLSGLEMDLRTVSRWIGDAELRRTVVVGISLSAPVVLRFAATAEPCAVVNIVPAVDIPRAVECATGDSMEQYRERRPGRPEFQTVLGYRVRAQRFTDDIDGHGFGTVDDAIRNVKAARCPTHFITGTSDVWVREADIRACLSVARPGSRWITVPDATHEFGRSLAKAKEFAHRLCELCRQSVGSESAPTEEDVPTFAQVIQASALESARIEEFIDQRIPDRMLAGVP